MHLEDEIRATHDRYVATRDRIEAGQLGWDALADFFTADATFIDPAWGRVEGLANAGDGRFSFEMDLLDMAHVNELIRESGWRPPASFNVPPRHPRR